MSQASNGGNNDSGKADDPAEPLRDVSQALTRPAGKLVTARKQLVQRIGGTLMGRRNWSPATVEAEDPEYDRKSLVWRPYLTSFLLAVVIPSIVCAIYFLAIASDQYQSETRLIVRSIDQVTPLDSGETETGSGGRTNYAVTSPVQNAYVLTNYLISRAAVEDVNKKLDLAEIFRRPGTDFVAILPKDATIDELVNYWQKMVSAYVDPTSGIVTIKVRSFRSEDSERLSQAIVASGEALLNRMTQKLRFDAIRWNEIEVSAALASVQKSLRDLGDFRNQDASIDPGASNERIVKLLMPLLTDSLKAKNDESVLASELTADAPSLRALRSRIAALDQQIAELRGQLTGPSSKTVAASLTRFEELDMVRLLNERKYARAQSALSRTEDVARRQGVYLSLFVPATAAEHAQYPLRIGYSLIVLAALIVLWGIAATIYASVEDHRL